MLRGYNDRGLPCCGGKPSACVAPPVPDYISLMPSLSTATRLRMLAVLVYLASAVVATTTNSKLQKELVQSSSGLESPRIYCFCVMEDIEPRRLRHKGKKYNDFEYDYLELL